MAKLKNVEIPFLKGNLRQNYSAWLDVTRSALKLLNMWFLCAKNFDVKRLLEPEVKVDDDTGEERQPTDKEIEDYEMVMKENSTLFHCLMLKIAEPIRKLPEILAVITISNETDLDDGRALWMALKSEAVVITAATRFLLDQKWIKQVKKRSQSISNFQTQIVNLAQQYVGTRGVKNSEDKAYAFLLGLLSDSRFDRYLETTLAISHHEQLVFSKVVASALQVEASFALRGKVDPVEEKEDESIVALKAELASTRKQVSDLLQQTSGKGSRSHGRNSRNRNSKGNESLPEIPEWARTAKCCFRFLMGVCPRGDSCRFPHLRHKHDKDHRNGMSSHSQSHSPFQSLMALSSVNVDYPFVEGNVVECSEDLSSGGSTSFTPRTYREAMLRDKDRWVMAMDE